MRKQVTTILLAAIYGAVASCSPKQEKQKEPIQQPQAPESNDLPGVVFLEQSGKQVFAKNLPGNTVLIFFGSECDHCQREATAIQANLKGFKKYQLYFVSLDPFPMITKFAEDYRLNHEPNIHFVRAEGNSVFNSLGNIQTPTILIYSADRKLVKRFDGETKVEDLLKLL